MINPKISIVIPVYNGSNYLAEAIDSALTQEYNNIEVIVVNDGSNDNGETERIALSYGNNIKYLAKENGGVSTALNFGIQNMGGEYFAWLSHDDIYYPNKIKEQIEALRNCKDMTAIVYSDYDLWDIEKNSIYNTNFCQSYTLEQMTNSAFPILQNITLSCTPLIHKSHFAKKGLFDEQLRTAQDNDMWFRLFRGNRTVFVSKALLKSRIHNEMGTKTISTFGNELGEVMTKCVMSVTQEEIKSMIGYPAVLYHKTSNILKEYGLKEYYQIVKAKYQETVIPYNIDELLKTFNLYIESLSEGIAKRVVIFGAGHYGRRLYHDLKSRLINVEFFVDNNENLWEKNIDGLLCISPNNLVAINNESIVIVASRIPSDIINQLKELGLSFITTYQALEGKLLMTPPLKWIDIFEGMDDYTDGIDIIKREFEESIFDICKHYNMRN